MRRKITMLIAAAMLALTMSVGGAGAAFAAPCVQNPDNKNCVTTNPGGQQQGCQGGNPQCETKFKGR